MAETPKKTRTTATKTASTAAKPRKTAAKKSANGAAAEAKPSNVHTMQDRSVSHDDVARLAHHYYQQRGHKHGHHVEDWLRAEQELRQKAS